MSTFPVLLPFLISGMGQCSTGNLMPTSTQKWSVDLSWSSQQCDVPSVLDNVNKSIITSVKLQENIFKKMCEVILTGLAPSLVLIQVLLFIFFS